MGHKQFAGDGADVPNRSGIYSPKLCIFRFVNYVRLYFYIGVDSLIYPCQRGKRVMSEAHKRIVLRGIISLSFWFSLVVFVGYWLNHLDRFLITNGWAFIWLFATPAGMGVLHIPTIAYTVFVLAAAAVSLWAVEIIHWCGNFMLPPDDEKEEDDDNSRNFEHLPH